MIPVEQFKHRLFRLATQIRSKHIVITDNYGNKQSLMNDKLELERKLASRRSLLVEILSKIPMQVDSAVEEIYDLFQIEQNLELINNSIKTIESNSKKLESDVGIRERELLHYIAETAPENLVDEKGENQGV